MSYADNETDRYSMPPGISWGLDCTGSAVQGLLGAKPQAIWPYVTGSDGIRWTEEQIAHFKDAGAVVYRVNQGYGAGPDAAVDGDEYDIERGAWTISQFCQIVAARRRISWSTRAYCTWVTYGAIKQQLAQAGTGRSCFFRIADWNLSEHLAELELHGDVYAGQYASPTSDPSAYVPGTTIPLAYANADLNVLLRTSTAWAG